MRTAGWLVGLFLPLCLVLLALSCGGDDGPSGPDNSAPSASFTVTPSFGTTSTSFQFDASGSSDAQDSVSVLQVRWDWENNGNWDTPWSMTRTASHQYATTGMKTIKLEVKDTGDVTDDTTQTISVTTPAELRLLSTTTIAEVVRKLDVVGDILYAAAEGSGVFVLNVSDPENPFELATKSLPENALAYQVAVHDKHAYVATHRGSGLYVLDVQDPSQPVVTGTCALPYSDAERVAIGDDLALVALYDGGVAVLSLVDLDTPELVSFLSLPEHTFDARFVPDCLGGRLAVATGVNSLYTLDLRVPSSPQVLDSLLLSDIPYGLSVDGTRVYVANRYAGLVAVDVACDGSLTLLGKLGLYGNARDVVVDEDRAYVASSEESGLLVVDVSSPSSMRLMEEVSLGSSKGVEFEDGLVYLGGGSISILGYE
jgi:hypothetical protein